MCVCGHVIHNCTTEDTNANFVCTVPCFILCIRYFIRTQQFFRQQWYTILNNAFFSASLMQFNAEKEIGEKK